MDLTVIQEKNNDANLQMMENTTVILLLMKNLLKWNVSTQYQSIMCMQK